MKLAKNWLLCCRFCMLLKFNWVPNPGDITPWLTGLGWFMGDVGLLASWFILGEGPVFGLLPNKLSKSMFMFPEFFHVEPTARFLSVVCFSVLLFVMEDVGWRGWIEVGVSIEPSKQKECRLYISVLQNVRSVSN